MSLRALCRVFGYSSATAGQRATALICRPRMKYFVRLSWGLRAVRCTCGISASVGSVRWPLSIACNRGLSMRPERQKASVACIIRVLLVETAVA